MKTTIKLFFAAAVVAFAASCSSKPAEPAAEEAAPQEEAAPAESTTPAETDSVEVAADTTQTAQ